MNIIQIIFVAVIGVAAWAMALGDVEVTDVTARQRYPWNGLVDIDYDLAGNLAGYDYQLSFVVTNIVDGKGYRILSLPGVNAVDGVFVVTCRSGRVVWNASKDMPKNLKTDGLHLYANIEVLRRGVQLWKNGPYWAECNVGATTPEEYGYYFWWGDSVGYKRNSANNGWVSVKDGSSFSFVDENCPTIEKDISQLRQAGYIDAKGNLVAKYDAATAHWGSSWRMPTEAEFSGLNSNCITVWTNYNGVSGRLVMGTGAYSSKSIFLPAAGEGHDDIHGRLDATGNYYWSSTPVPDDSYFARRCSWSLYFYSKTMNPNELSRRFGLVVRPVRVSVP